MLANQSHTWTKWVTVFPSRREVYPVLAMQMPRRLGLSSRRVAGEPGSLILPRTSQKRAAESCTR